MRRSDRKRLATKTLPGSLKISIEMARARCLRSGLEISITLQGMIDVYIRQNGMCAITGRRMVWDSRGERCPDLISIDRIDSSRGYTPDNVQLVTIAANKAKNDLTEREFDELVLGMLETREKSGSQRKHLL